MTDSAHDGVGLSIRQLCAAWRVMCRDAPGLRAASADAIDYIFSGLRSPSSTSRS